jgi:hypothetical protein
LARRADERANVEGRKICRRPLPANEFGNKDNGNVAYSLRRNLSPPRFSRPRRKDLGAT